MIPALLSLLVIATEPPTAAEPAAALPPPASVPAQESRMQAYEEFRAFYETARYQEALPLARRIVTLSETGDDRDLELPIAYNNLGATQYQLGDYPAAEASYRQSLEILETTQGISSRRMIVPLAGLGTVFAASNQHAIAVELFDRALAVSRRADGLFNLAQLPLIEQLATSRLAIGDLQGVERERLYALRIAEQNYGYQDARTLPPVLALAEFYEAVQQYVAARLMYLRARDISMSESGGFNPLAIRSLIGISRNYRLQYTMQPETLEASAPAPVSPIERFPTEVIDRTYLPARSSLSQADRTGLEPVMTALELLRAAPDPPRPLLAKALIEIGDWYQSTSRIDQSLPYYVEASSLFVGDALPGEGNPLREPRLLFYRAPTQSLRKPGSNSGDYELRKTVYQFAVTESGKPDTIGIVSTTMTEGQVSLSGRAVSRAIYSPRILDGKPVATDGITFTADWYEKRVATEPAAKPADEETAEPAAEPAAEPVAEPGSASGT